MTNRQKKLLVLTPRFPYPPIGGDRLRIYEICRVLSQEFSLTLLSLCEKHAEMSMQIPQDGVFDRVERIFLPRYKSYLNAALSLFGPEPMQVAYYKSLAFAAALEAMLPEHDGVFVHLIRCAEYVRERSAPRILEMTDAISMNYERICQLGKVRGIRAAIYRLEAVRLRAYERAVLNDFDLSILVSDVDKTYLVGDAHKNVLVCTNGVSLGRLPFRKRRDGRPVIVCIGNMTSLQNLEACFYFAEEVMPLLCARISATFRVVGRISRGDAAKLRAYANVEVTGLVEDIADAVKDASVGVCPVRLGAGVQNKVLEYMALGLPAIVSPVGLEGLRAQPGIDLLVASSPAEYVDAIASVLSDVDLAEALALGGLSYVRDHHNWSQTLAPMMRRISSLVN